MQSAVCRIDYQHSVSTHFFLEDSLDPVPLCQHCSQSPYGSLLLPISLLSHDPFFSSSLKVRAKMLERGRKALEANLSRLDDWQTQVEAQLEAFKSELFATIDRVRCDLEEEITRVLAEAAETLEQNFPTGLSRLACELRRFSADLGDRFQLIDFSLVSQPNISLSYRRINSSWGNTIVAVESDRICLFDPDTKKWGPLNLTLSREITANSHSSTALLSNYEVLVCGGNSTDVYIINALTGQIKPAGALQKARNDPALVWVAGLGEAYLFGGLEEQVSTGALRAMASCEVLIPEVNLPRQIDEMTCPRALFTPCIWENRVYLCGGGQTTIEIFDLHTQKYSEKVDMSLSPTSAWSCSAVLQDNWLIVLSYQHIWRWNLLSGETKKVLHNSNYTRSICAPVLRQGLIYILMGDEREGESQTCLEVDLGSGRLKDRFALPVRTSEIE